jgi:hypothetical protein
MLRNAAILVACLFATASYGQAPDQMALLNDFILSPGYQDFLAHTVNDVENIALKAKCGHLLVLEAEKYQIIDQPLFKHFADGDRLISGRWVSVVIVDRCGEKATRRLLVRYVPEQDRFEAQALLPGEFRGNFILELNAFRTVTIEMLADTRCNDRGRLYMLDVKSLGPATDGKWSEIWTAEACGKIVRQLVRYSTLRDGIDVHSQSYKP